MIVNPLQRLASTRQRLLALHLSSLESERHRIALDLHDGLGQSLTVLTVGLRTIEETSTESAVQAQARELRRIGGNTHDELRRLVHGMRPAVLDDLGLIPALERFVGDLNVSNCIEARLQVHCVAAVNLCEEVQISVFRMVQEAATNAIRHGNARQLTIKMNCDALTLKIEIEDDGIGFDTAKNLNSDQTGSNLGLLSVHERACLLGGEAMVSSSPGAGTQVRVQVPLRRKDSMNE